MSRTPSDSQNDTDVYDESEWETVAEESADVVVFETPGQSFVGTYVGEETIEPPNDEPFTRYLFRDRNGDLRAVNQSYKVQRGMEKVNAGDTVRLTYVKDVPAKNGFQPMKDIKVQVRRATN